VQGITALHYTALHCTALHNAKGYLSFIRIERLNPPAIPRLFSLLDASGRQAGELKAN
jgi:hypothetical protein